MTYLLFLYRKRKTFRFLVVGEALLSLWFLADTLNTYIRNVLLSDGAIGLLHVLSSLTGYFGIAFILLFVAAAHKQAMQFRFTLPMKAVICAATVCLLLAIAACFVTPLQSVPFLCFAFVLQCLFGFLLLGREAAPSAAKEIMKLRGLTERETEIVEHLIRGESLQEIGGLLFISPNTVKNHTYNIYKKLEVKNRVELLNLLKREG